MLVCHSGLPNKASMDCHKPSGRTMCPLICKLAHVKNQRMENLTLGKIKLGKYDKVSHDDF